MALTGREKATIFLSILGADVSSRVLRYLPDELADLIAAGINHLPSPSPDALAEVINEYNGFLALPPSAPPPVFEPVPATPKKNFAPLLYERPQLTAFIVSLLPEEEKEQFWRAFPKQKAGIEELVVTLKETPLRARLEEQLRQQFAGTVF
jgi:flagellar motor switch protein FliG